MYSLYQIIWYLKGFAILWTHCGDSTTKRYLFMSIKQFPDLFYSPDLGMRKSISFGSLLGGPSGANRGLEDKITPGLSLRDRPGDILSFLFASIGKSFRKLKI